MKLFAKLKEKILNPWIILHIPAVIMVLMLCSNYRLFKKLISLSGYCALAFLVITLMLNPLKAFRPKWTWVLKLNRYRRQLGVACFSYTLIHFSCFIIKRFIGGFWNSLGYFLHPAIVPVFFIAFPILLMLAITSNNYSVKKLSFVRWKKLHKSVYIAEIAIVVHLVLTGNMRLMLISFAPLLFLQVMRSKLSAK